MKTDIENLPSSPELLQKIVLDLQQSVHALEQEKAELLSYKQKYNRLLEELRLAKQRLYSSSSEKNAFQVDLFDEPGSELSEEVKAQLEDTIEINSYTRKKHPTRRALPKDLPHELRCHLRCYFRKSFLIRSLQCK
jgi:transposase